MEPINNPSRHFQSTLPNAISIGARDTGKTFNFLQLCKAKTWGSFLESKGSRDKTDKETLIFPFLSPKNSNPGDIEIIEDCQIYCLRRLGLWHDFSEAYLHKRINLYLQLREIDWSVFWMVELLCVFNLRWMPGDAQDNSIKELSDFLSKKNKRLIILIDGLSDHFTSPNENKNECAAIKSLLCLPSGINELNSGNLGVIEFVRYDYVRAATRQGSVPLTLKYAELEIDNAQQQEDPDIKSTSTDSMDLKNADIAADTMRDIITSKPLRNLANHYQERMPTVVSVSAHGTNKTFNFLQLCKAKTWANFLESMGAPTSNTKKTIIFPLLSPLRLDDANQQMINDCCENCYHELGLKRVFSEVDLGTRINSNYINQVEHKNTDDWNSFWVSELLSVFGVDGKRLSHLNNFFISKNIRVVILVDGLRDYFPHPKEDLQQQSALRSLLYIPGRIDNLRESHLGAVEFVLPEYVQTAIQMDAGPFMAKYADFELTDN